MKPVKILTDSCSDLGKDIRTQYGIDYVKMATVYEGKETPASLDWEYYSAKELYDTMRDPKNSRITTTQVSVKEFESTFTKLIKEGFDVVYISCSGALSGSINTGTVVANSLKEEYPDAEIYCVDSTNASLGEGLLAVRAAQYAKEGKSAKEIAAIIEKERHFVNQVATVESLTMLKKAGRVSASSAFFGNLMGVKPIIISNRKGENVAIKKIMGRKASIKELINMLSASIANPEEQTIYLSHADCADDANALAKEIKEATHCKDVYINYMGPIIGASIGPSGIGVFAMGKEVID